MIGWLIFAGLAVLVLGALWALGVARGLWMFVLSAIVLGAAGYSIQGHPGLPGAPVERSREIGEIDQPLVDMRDKMFGMLTYERPYFVAADALMRKGSTEAAVKLMLGGVRHQPRNAFLWTWLGMTYVAHDEGSMSPPARLAFDRAVALAPQHSGPQFFYGVALLRAGAFDEARRRWARALALCPPDASYCGAIRERLILLDRYMAMAQQERRAQ